MDLELDLQNSITLPASEELPSISGDMGEIARARHDILSPLNAAMGFLELLEESGELSDRQRRYLANTKNSLASAVAAVSSLQTSKLRGRLQS
jgi:signal transduction histidine kinase